MFDALVDNYHDAGRVVELDGRVGRPIVTCPHALRRVLMNLIDNALRYGTDVRLRVRVEAQHLVLAVLDSGPGIAPSQLAAVFEPWYRAPESAAKAKGSGLGLAIARRLVKAMRGDLQLRNRRGGGLEGHLAAAAGDRLRIARRRRRGDSTASLERQVPLDCLPAGGVAGFRAGRRVAR